jgi:methionyl-tRNA synthetase
MGEFFYVTTAIDYTNAPPHIGHAYEKVLTDVIARYQRLKGVPVFFLTGVDQHGQKVQQSAEKKGVDPQQFVDEMTAKFRSLWERLDVEYDAWAATTDPGHKNCVQAILQRLWDEGQIYKDKQGGHYSIRQEQFLTDKERGADGQFGPEWGEVEFREEENYYFKLAAHKDWLLGFIKKSLNEAVEKGRGFVVPSFRQSELLNAVQKLGGDLCVSRPKSRLAWGIEFPFDRDYVTYVWFDALVNYISFAGYDPAAATDNKRFRELWPAWHVIGKDILIPAHGVYWPIMLHALGFADDEIPQLLVHGWWNVGGSKMSKSSGNVIDPNDLVEKFGSDPVRYYLMRDISTGGDADFSDLRMQERYNADLANDLGNLLNRTLSMAARYRNGILRRGDSPPALSAETNAAKEEYMARMEEFQIQAALDAVWKLISRCNGFVETSAPWKMAKVPSRAGELDAVLYGLAECLRVIAIMVAPVIPKAAKMIFAQLQITAGFSLSHMGNAVLPDGHALGTPSPLFPRLDEPEE